MAHCGGWGSMFLTGPRHSGQCWWKPSVVGKGPVQRRVHGEARAPNLLGSSSGCSKKVPWWWLWWSRCTQEWPRMIFVQITHSPSSPWVLCWSFACSRSLIYFSLRIKTAYLLLIIKVIYTQYKKSLKTEKSIKEIIQIICNPISQRWVELIWKYIFLGLHTHTHTHTCTHINQNGTVPYILCCFKNIHHTHFSSLI